MGLETLRKRAEFLAIRGGGRWSGAAFVMEAKPRTGDGASGGPRFGFTVTKKLGKAIVRNRIRRRLREAVRTTNAAHARAGYDYVVVARQVALTRPFGELVKDLEQAFRRVHKGPRDSPEGRRKG